MTRIGLLWPQTGSAWAAGQLYFESLLESLSLAGHGSEVVVIEPDGGLFGSCNRQSFGDISYRSYATISPSPSLSGKVLRHLRTRLRRHSRSFVDCVRSASVDVLFGDLDVNLDPPVPWVGWIPDFQHLHYPHFFNAQELAERKLGYRALAVNSTLLLLSSHDVEADFARFAPDLAHKARIAPFVSVMPLRAFEQSPEDVIRRYGVGCPYVLVPNQWWAHKNHLVAIRAAALLRDRDVTVQWIATGALSDYRNPEHISRLLQEIARTQLGGVFVPLGVLPRLDQLALMKGASCVVQPSLFEGWSTVVEDARTLGQGIVLSDIPVHREQDPPHASYFAAGDAEGLASAVIEQLGATPRSVATPRDYEGSLCRARDFGMRFYDICSEAARL